MVYFVCALSVCTVALRKPQIQRLGPITLVQSERQASESERAPYFYLTWSVILPYLKNASTIGNGLYESIGKAEGEDAIWSWRTLISKL